MKKHILFLLLTLGTVTMAYSNHFRNTFHFDDSHTIVENSYIRNIRNIPSFFIDARRFSILPSNRSYRPVVTASIAVDFWLKRHLPIKSNGMFWFHLQTFLWFLCQLVAIYFLFTAILERTVPGSDNRYAALFATAWYGLHPANAETVNYIIQRGDVYSTAGVVAGLTLYAMFPRRRRTGLYLLPVIIGLLAKAPAVVFPLLLSLYVVYFEPSLNWKIQLRDLIRKTWPAWGVMILLAWLQATLTPKTYTPTNTSSHDYLITQPYVLWRYFKNFVLPVHLSADTELRAFHTIEPAVLVGFLFLAALVTVMLITARDRLTRPISYGLAWFIVASLPTSVYSLSDVENDHRMYFPFVGLVLAATWFAVLALRHLAAIKPKFLKDRIPLQAATWTVAFFFLAGCAYGVHVRNNVWRTERSLWWDVIHKSPRNARGLASYGVALMEEGDDRRALAYMKHAEEYNPAFFALRTNMGRVYMDLNQMENAGRQYQLAIAISPQDDRGRVQYGGWLAKGGHLAETLEQLKIAYDINPDNTATRDDLMEVYAGMGDLDSAKQLAKDTLKLFPSEPTALQYAENPPVQDLDYWVKTSTVRHHLHFEGAAVDAARRALRLNPNSAEAYHCLGAAYGGMAMWQLAAANESKSLALKPDFAEAKANLAWIQTELHAAAGSAAATVENLIDSANHLLQTGEFEEALAAAQDAARMRSDAPAPYDTLAIAYSALHRWDEALAATNKALSLDPNDQAAKQNLAWETLSAQVEKKKKRSEPTL